MVDNPRAFPTPVPCDNKGMNLLDWFAGQTLPATTQMAGANPRLSGLGDAEIVSWAADVAYKVAKAMLSERAKGPQ
jgi:hypothetical protein